MRPAPEAWSKNAGAGAVRRPGGRGRRVGGGRRRRRRLPPGVGTRAPCRSSASSRPRRTARVRGRRGETPALRTALFSPHLSGDMVGPSRTRIRTRARDGQTAAPPFGEHRLSPTCRPIAQHPYPPGAGPPDATPSRGHGQVRVSVACLPARVKGPGRCSANFHLRANLHLSSRAHCSGRTAVADAHVAFSDRRANSSSRAGLPSQSSMPFSKYVGTATIGSGAGAPSFRSMSATSMSGNRAATARARPRLSEFRGRPVHSGERCARRRQ